MEKDKVFIDSSVLISAVLSSRGGSFYLLTQLKDKYEFQINEYVLEEVLKVLNSKFSSMVGLRSNLFLIIATSGIKIHPNPALSKIKPLLKVINKEDAPILASALAHSKYLLTFDEDFLQKPVVDFARKKKLTILKPKDFIESYQR